MDTQKQRQRRRDDAKRTESGNASFSWYLQSRYPQRTAARRALEWIGASKSRLVFRYEISDLFFSWSPFKYNCPGVWCGHRPRGWQRTYTISLCTCMYEISKSRDFNSDFMISTKISDFYSHSPQNSMISLHSSDFTTDFWFQYLDFWFQYKFLISILISEWFQWFL